MARRAPARMRPAGDAAPRSDVVQPDKGALTGGGFRALLESAAQEILAVTYWFDPAPHPEPYPVTIRFSGRRVDVQGRLSPGDRFVQDETIEQVIPMQATFSYTSILHAVGQVLDQIDVKSIAIHEEEDGLFVEGVNGEGQLQVQLRYDIAGLYDLLCRSEDQLEKHSEHVTAEYEGTLQRFLADHGRELIGASC